jgi:hypothetical protein
VTRWGLRLLAVIVIALDPVTASAQDTTSSGTPDLAVATAARYSGQPEVGRVEVEFEYRFENVGDDVAFPGFFESLPTSALEVGATDGRDDLAVSVVGESDGFTVWFVAFDRELSPGRSGSVTLRWVIDSAADGVILEPGAMVFDVYTPGPEGAVVQPAVVELPVEFESTASWPRVTDDALGDGRAAFVVETPGPYQTVSVGFVDRGSFVTRTVDRPAGLTIANWTATDRWTADIEQRASAVVDELDAWFGPHDGVFEVRRGLPTDGHPPVLVGEEVADGEVPVVVVETDAAAAIDHQLAHVWLADVPVDEAWFVEGSAAAFAGDQPNPGGASEIVAPLVDEIGARGIRAVIDALRTQTITYPGIEREVQPLPPDWRTVLDLLEGVGGSSTASDLFRSAVVDATEAAEIELRAAARTDFSALADRAGSWTLPPLLRSPMAEWDFAGFFSRQASVSDVIARRDSLQAWASDLDLVDPDDAQELFEQAEVDMAEITALFDERQAALEAFSEAKRLVTGDRGLLARVGLIGDTPDADLEQLRESWAAGDYRSVERGGLELVDLVEGAVGQGTLRILFPTVLVIAMWQSVAWMVRRRRAQVATS